jgi:hypothetical protein
VLVGRERLLVLAELREPFIQAPDRDRQVSDVAAGEVLLVEVVLFQEVESLEFCVRLSKREHGRVARRDRLDLGVGEFLAADVFGTAGGVVSSYDLRNESGLGFEGLIG